MAVVGAQEPQSITFLLLLTSLWYEILSSLRMAFERFLTPIAVPNTRLTGHTAIVTGANAGLGYEIALDLARREARVIMVCRNIKKAKVACDAIRQASGSQQVEYRIVNMSSLSQVKKFAETMANEGVRLDLLVSNAGVLATQAVKQEDGFEESYAVNVLAPLLMTVMLFPCFNPGARIITHSSAASKLVPTTKPAILTGRRSFEEPKRKSLIGGSFYANSKFCQVVMARQLAASPLFKSKNLKSYSAHPGVVSSEIWNQPTYKAGNLIKTFIDLVVRLIAVNASIGARMVLILCTSPQTTLEEACVTRRLPGQDGRGNGTYWSEGKPQPPHPFVYRRPEMEVLWRQMLADAGLPEDGMLRGI